MKTLIVRYIVPLIFLVIAFAGIAHMITETVRGVQPAFELQALDVKGSVAASDRGRHLFETRGCADCHGVDAGGKVFLESTPTGVFAGSNLTKGSGGVGQEYKTISDWQRAIRFGVNVGGHPIVFMPSYEYTSLSKQDLGALILYLYNLPPVNRTVPRSNPGLVPRMLYLIGQMPVLFSFSSIDTQASLPDSVPEARTPEYGKYVAVTCVGCHRENMRGGRIKGAPPDWPAAPDITKSGALKDYSPTSFAQALRRGEKVGGGTIKAEHMPWPSLGKMNDNEIEALYLYLQTL